MPEAAADTATETTDTAPTARSLLSQFSHAEGVPLKVAERVEGDEADEADTADLADELEKWKAMARKHEQRAKENATAAQQLEELRRTAMSDQERAIEDARAAARAETIQELAAEVVDARIAEQAAGRLSPEQIATLTTGLDRAKFLDPETGKVDVEAVTAFVDGIAPPQTGPRPVDLGQGARSSSIPLNGDPILDSLKSKLGIR